MKTNEMKEDEMRCNDMIWGGEGCMVQAFRVTEYVDHPNYLINEGMDE